MGYVHVPAPGEGDLREFLRREWEDVERAFSESVRRRGKAYLDTGAILPVEVKDREAVFSSSGDYMPFYRITIRLDGEALTAFCSCPYSGPCKHIYASLRMIKEGVKEGVKGILMKLDREEAVDLLIDFMPQDVRAILLKDPWKVLEDFRAYGDLAPITGVLPFVPLRYGTAETLNFLESLLNVLQEMDLPCPPTLPMAIKRTVRMAEDRVGVLLRVYDLLIERGCTEAMAGVGDVLGDEERERALSEGIPYEVLKGEGREVLPPFSSAEACVDYILLRRDLDEEDVRRIAENCMGRFGLFTPLVLLYLKAGGREGVARSLLARQPRASLLRTLEPLISHEMREELVRLLRELSPEEYVKYVEGTERARDILTMADRLGRETLVEAVRRNVKILGREAVPLLREEILRISGGRRWSRYPYVRDLLLAIKTVSPEEYKRLLSELRSRYKGKRRLMKVLEGM